MSHLAALKGIDSPLSSSDHFFTPEDRLLEWHKEFRFTLDPCGHPEAPAAKIIPHAWFWPDTDGLATSWAGERIFSNFPYSDCDSWVRKAFVEIQAGCPLIVQLGPANKTEQPWWQECIEPFRDRRPEPGQRFSLETRFLKTRLVHGMPAMVLAEINAKRASDGKKPLTGREAGTFPSMLLIWRAF